jgi:S1-C subfamily serine protease
MMRENESDREGQPGRSDNFGDDALPPYYADSYTEPVESYQAEPERYRPSNPANDDTVVFPWGALPPDPPGSPWGAVPPDPPSVGNEPPDWGNWTLGGGYGSPPPPPHRVRTGRVLIYVGVAIVAAAIGAGATVAFNGSSTTPSAGVSSHENIPSQQNNAAGSGSSARLNPAFVERKVEPGIVDIVSTLEYNSETAEGTGMILSSDGLVLTNNHVIDQSTSVKAVRVDGGRQYNARVLGYDATDDVALLQLEGASHLPVVNLGNSDQVSIGTPVLALGNAEGRGGVTPASGIINALNRSIKASDEGSGGTENLHGMLQTSAQIQQGDSGGPLANSAGQIIGMITAANTTSNQPNGTIGFAIPINSALSIARQVASKIPSANIYIGTPGFLGVVLAQSTSSDPQQQNRDEQAWLAQKGNNNLTGPGGHGQSCIENDNEVSAPDNVAPADPGVLVVGTFCGTSVNQAGLVPGDVITSVDGHAVTTPDALQTLTGSYHPGDAITLGWEDASGGRHTNEITLGAGPVR